MDNFGDIGQLKADIKKLKEILGELLDIVEGQTMYNEFDKEYMHSYMSDGERLWELLGLSEPNIPEKEFYEAIEHFKQSLGIEKGGIGNA